MKIRQHPLRFILLAVLIGGLGTLVAFLLFFVPQRSSATEAIVETKDILNFSLAEMGDANIKEGALYLQVPLDETATEREQFVAELDDRLDSDLLRHYYLRDLYENYIDRIGANGLITSLNTVRQHCHCEGPYLGQVL